MGALLDRFCAGGNGDGGGPIKPPPPASAGAHPEAGGAGVAAAPGTGGGGGGGGAASLPLPPPPTHRASAEALADAREAIDEAAAELDEDGAGGGAPRRSNRPLYYFHPPGEAVYGTAVLFHGFSGEPYGMRWIADYLFKAGWNVYSTILAGHAYKSAAWPTVALKPSLGGGDALAAAIARNPDLAAAVGDPASAAGDPAAAAQLFATLTTEVPALAGAGPLGAYLGALEPGGDPDAFAARFDSTAGDYGAVAEAALRHVAGLPGPVVAVGSSVGGAAALWAGAVGGGRVSHVLACAPLLRLYREDRRQMAMAVGPLGIGPEQGWSPTNRFPLSCFTANDVFGGTVATTPAVVEAYSSRRTKLFLMLTENEDAADIPTNRAFFASVADGAGADRSSGPVGTGGADGGHVLGWYPRSARVPHPMVDPTEVSQGMSNAFWGALMQETHRFFTTGRVDVEHLSSTEPADGLPPPPSSPGRGWP